MCQILLEIVGYTSNQSRLLGIVATLLLQARHASCHSTNSAKALEAASQQLKTDL